MSRTASPGPVFHAVANDPENAPFDAPQTDKISAYYSLVFPKFTYYLQTLSVTIGRRCIPASTASTSDQAQVDVDLGPLKSVSRLHARIEYEDEEEDGGAMDEQEREAKRREKRRLEKARRRAMGSRPELAGIDAK